MSYSRLRQLVPPWLRKQVFHFEESIEHQVHLFAASLKHQARVLDAGAGEGRHRLVFASHRYVAVDLGIGDRAWNYSGLDCVADLLHLPFCDCCFDAAISIVTLEHVTDPAAVLAEMARTSRPGAPLLLVVPQDWEVHQHPHDYWRFTRFGIEMLLEKTGWQLERMEAGGGYFRLLSRRLMNGLQFLPAWLMPIAAILVAPAAIAIGYLDPLDSRRDFTVGYICWAKRKIL